jgi:hypothetical protein
MTESTREWRKHAQLGCAVKWQQTVAKMGSAEKANKLLANWINWELGNKLLPTLEGGYHV